MRRGVISILGALAVAMSFAADGGAQSAFDSGFGATSPISDEALSAVTSNGDAFASGNGQFVSQFVKDFSGDLVTVDDNVTAGLVSGSAGGSFPIFGSSPVGRFTHPNF